MPDRLSELARQRALVSEHLAWLDREIERETAERSAPATALPATALPATPLPPAPLPPAPPVSGAVGAASGSGATTTEGDRILEQYRVESTSLKQDVRKGCLLYFVAAFVLLGVVVAVLYFAIGTR